MSHGPGTSLQFSYDLANEMTQVVDPSGAVATFGYDDLGRRTGIARPNGVNTVSSYDAISRPSQLRFDFSGGAGAQTLNFEYNAACQPARDLDPRSASNIDPAGRVIERV